MYDGHVHTQFSPHSQCEAFDIAEAAALRSVKLLGYAEHWPLPPGYDDPIGDSSMVPDDIDHYCTVVQAIKLGYYDAGLDVRCGSEVDYLPEFRDVIREGLDLYETDYRLLVVRFLGDWPFPLSKPDYERGIAELYGSEDAVFRAYFEVLKEGVDTGWFHAVTRLDLVKKFSDLPGTELATRYREDIMEVLTLMAERNMVLELNTAGLDMYCREMFPSRAILMWARDLGLPMMLGSGAHATSQVARHFSEAYRLLRDLGVRELTAFRGGEPESVPLPAEVDTGPQVL